MNSYAPLVSVIVPAWNEAVGIITTLKSLTRQSYSNIEIIVVNDGSTDNTSQVVRSYLRASDQRRIISLIDQPNMGKAKALNAGIKAARGDMILTIDADSVAAKDTVKNLVVMMCESGADGAVGNIQIAHTTYMLGLMQWIEYKFTFFLKKAESILGTLYVVGGAAAMYRRSVFDDVGLFKTNSLTEDLDFALRMLDKGKQIIYVDDALVLTEGARDLRGLLKQRVRWRLGKLKAFYRYRSMFFSRNKSVNRGLAYFGLPWALISEIMVLLEPILFLGFLYYIYINSAYSYAVTIIACIAIMVFYVSTLDKRRRKKAFFLSPIMWAVFLLNSLVEFTASIVCIYSVITGKEVKWQSWQRSGIVADPAALTSPAHSMQALNVITYVKEKLNVLLGFIIVIYFSVLLVFFYYLLYSGVKDDMFSKFFVAVFYILGTDTILLLFHIYRKPTYHKQLSLDRDRLSILIISYNGEKIIGETIRQALLKVSPKQIYVVSDCSTDKTAEVAKSYGVSVFVNRKNMNKALSINLAAKHIKTPYVLILDDDTHIGDTVIPTNLMDEGYSAVAFNVMPEKQAGPCNAFQQFEYRKAMYLGKSLRSKVGAIGNVSGAIGLFRSKDIKTQARLHTGQFGGEDQQRTVLVQLLQEANDKGIAYVDSLVLTEPPASFSALFKQRAFKWGMAVHENFFLFIKLLRHHRVHPLLKFERAYLLFVFLSDPIRILLTPLLIFQYEYLPVFYVLYLLLELAAWLKTGRQDPLTVVLLAPLYSMFRNTARFVAYFYWLKVKFDYIFLHRFHRLISSRPLRLEYATVACVMAITVAFAVFGALDDYGQLIARINPFR